MRGYKQDNREAKVGWCPGTYCCRCVTCDALFIGNKRAHVCADCAYAPPKPPQYTSHVCAWLIERFNRAWSFTSTPKQ